MTPPTLIPTCFQGVAKSQGAGARTCVMFVRRNTEKSLAQGLLHCLIA